MNLISMSFSFRCSNRVQIYSEDHLTYPQGMAWHRLNVDLISIVHADLRMNLLPFEGLILKILHNFNNDMF